MIENGALRDTSAFAEVRLIPGVMSIDGNSALERITMPELQEVGGDLRIERNPALTTLELDALRRAASIEVRYNTLLPSCAVADLASSVVSSRALQCDNAADECATACPLPP